MDDFIGAEDEKMIWEAFGRLLELLEKLSFDISDSKTIQPISSMEALGVLMDVANQLIIVTPEIIQEILIILDNWKCEDTCTLKELQSLIGKLQFLSKCLRPGRVFVAILLNFLQKM